MSSFLLVGLGGAVGAMARHGANIAIGSLPNGFPAATFLVNVTGSLAMGLLIGWLAQATPQHQQEIRLFFAVGVFGGFTTFSSFSLDTISLIERGDYLLAAAYVAGSVLLAVTGLIMGLWAIRVLA
ncbi:MAG TPA: fluoride efflux transporter CrcB [Devosiaceae bacterium]|jgi:CrcB protein|nr:fluoride efflux transporter CrcB [Devosiaceae bacterium]